MAAGNKRRIRNFLINPGYQLRLILWLTLVSVLLLAMNAWIFYRSFNENYAILLELAPMAGDTKNQLAAEMTMILFKLGTVSFLFLLVVSLLGIVFSHRVAGPLYKFKKVFREIQAGDPELRIHLRRDDEFRDVAEAFNEMMDSIAKKGQ